MISTTPATSDATIADTRTVQEWLSRDRFYPEHAPDDVFEAHMRLQNDIPCESVDCAICHVFCDVCAVHYERDEPCIFH